MTDHLDKLAYFFTYTLEVTLKIPCTVIDSIMLSFIGNDIPTIYRHLPWHKQIKVEPPQSIGYHVTSWALHGTWTLYSKTYHTPVEHHIVMSYNLNENSIPQWVNNHQMRWTNYNELATTCHWILPSYTITWNDH